MRLEARVAVWCAAFLLSWFVALSSSGWVEQAAAISIMAEWVVAAVSVLSEARTLKGWMQAETPETLVAFGVGSLASSWNLKRLMAAAEASRDVLPPRMSRAAHAVVTWKRASLIMLVVAPLLAAMVTRTFRL